MMDMVDAGITAFAALVSLAAAIIAARALRAQIAAPRRERRSAAYHALLVDPALRLLPELEIDAARLLDQAIAKLEQLEAENVGIKAARAERKAFVDRYDALHQPVSYRLLGAASAWRDGDFAQELNDALDQLYDDVTNGIDALAGNAPVTPPLHDRLRAGVANALSIVVHHEIEKPPPPGKARRAIGQLPVIGKLLIP